MTVAEAVAVLTRAEKIYIGWDMTSKELDRENVLDMDAYGQYQVDRIDNYFDAGKFELVLAARPVKAEESAEK